MGFPEPATYAFCANKVAVVADRVARARKRTLDRGIVKTSACLDAILREEFRSSHGRCPVSDGFMGGVLRPTGKRPGWLAADGDAEAEKSMTALVLVCSNEISSKARKKCPRAQTLCAMAEETGFSCRALHFYFFR